MTLTYRLLLPLTDCRYPNATAGPIGCVAGVNNCVKCSTATRTGPLQCVQCGNGTSLFAGLCIAPGVAALGASTRNKPILPVLCATCAVQLLHAGPAVLSRRCSLRR